MKPMKKNRMRICGRNTITPLTPEITPSVTRLRKSPSGIQPGTSDVPVIFAVSAENPLSIHPTGISTTEKIR